MHYWQVAYCSGLMHINVAHTCLNLKGVACFSHSHTYLCAAASHLRACVLHLQGEVQRGWPPCAPQTDPNHMVLPIEDPCFQNSYIDKAGGELLTVSVSNSSNNGSTAFKIEAQAPKIPKTPKTDIAVNAMPSQTLLWTTNIWEVITIPKLRHYECLFAQTIVVCCLDDWTPCGC